MLAELTRVQNESYEDFIVRYLEVNNLTMVSSGGLANKMKRYKKLSGNQVARILISIGWIRLSLTVNRTYCFYVKNEETAARCLV